MRISVFPIWKTFVFAISFAGLATFQASGQPPLKQLDFNKHAWVSYSGEHDVTKRWGIHFDAQWRRADLGTEWQQYQLRPALNYRLSPAVLLTAGYAYTRSYPYGDNPVAAPIPEHRSYEQLLVTSTPGRLRIQNRSRLEQRFIKYPNSIASPPWTYQNRFRHMVRLQIPLSADGRWYLPTYDEILMGIPPNYGARSFDQNRVFVGIGRSAGPVNVEVGYLNQFIGQRNGQVFEMNNTVVLAITSNASLAGLWSD